MILIMFTFGCLAKAGASTYNFFTIPLFTDLNEANSDSLKVLVLRNDSIVFTEKMGVTSNLSLTFEADDSLTFIFLSDGKFMPITIQDYPDTNLVGYQYPIFIIPKEINLTNLNNYNNYLGKLKKWVRNREDDITFIDGLRVPLPALPKEED